MIGRTPAHYRILERIGAGGMGEVYRAHDESLDPDVTLGTFLLEAGHARAEPHNISKPVQISSLV